MIFELFMTNVVIVKQSPSCIFCAVFRMIHRKLKGAGLDESRSNFGVSC